MAKTANRLFNKRGRIIALDTKYTGDEPEWGDADEISSEEYNKRLDRGLRFYSYYCDNKVMKPWVLDWMKKNGFVKEQIEIIKAAPPSYVNGTVGKLIRMLNMGMPNKRNIKGWIKSELNDSLYEINRMLNDPKRLFDESKKEDVPVKKVVSPLTRVENKINEDIIVPLDMLLDDIININTDTTPAKIPSMDIGGLLRGNKAAGNGVKHVVAWLTKHLNEFKAAYDKTDDDAVEGYSWLRRAQLNRIVLNFEKMLEDTKLYNKSKVKARMPRKKKTPTVERQLQRLKYATDSAEYKLTSVDPSTLPFAQRALFFNTKNRQLSVYYASGNAGFQIKGTTLNGFDENRSVIMSLRKPMEFLPVVLSATPKALDKALETLTTKPRKGNGRINQNMIILRTLDTK